MKLTATSSPDSDNIIDTNEQPVESHRNNEEQESQPIAPPRISSRDRQAPESYETSFF